MLPSLSHLSILDILVSISKLSKAASDSEGGSMAIWVVKFLREEYKIRKIFEQKSAYSKTIIHFANRRSVQLSKSSKI